MPKVVLVYLKNENKPNKQTEINPILRKQTKIRKTNYKANKKIKRFICVQKRKSRALRKIRFENQTINW